MAFLKLDGTKGLIGGLRGCKAKPPASGWNLRGKTLQTYPATGRFCVHWKKLPIKFFSVFLNRNDKHPKEKPRTKVVIREGEEEARHIS